jgi:uncharacterized protein (DUF983 family)
MGVTRGQILSRGVANECPNCATKTLFPAGSFRIHRRCPRCGLLLDPGEGFFLGPLVINYTLTVFGFVLPLIWVGISGFIPLGPALAVAVVGGLGIPVLLYRRSWGWWLMIYFFFLPDKLPANGGGAADER